MALTATATCHTRQVIQKSLCMTNCATVIKVPNRVNIQYTVRHKTCNRLEALLPIVDSIMKHGREAEKYIVFCRSYNDAVQVHETLANELGTNDCLFFDGEATCELFSGSLPNEDKCRILSDFTQPKGALRVVIATIAFGMGIDAPNIRHIIHWGPPTTMEEYIQESGRCGRDGVDSTATLYFVGSDLGGLHPPTYLMQSYCKNESKCRRELLLQEFYDCGVILKPTPSHRCCDICAFSCECDDCLYTQTLQFLDCESCVSNETSAVANSLTISPEQQKLLQKALSDYRLSLVSEHVSCPLFGVEISTGITDSLISDVVSNSQKYTNISQLISHGLSHEHSTNIIRIINEHNS